MDMQHSHALRVAQEKWAVARQVSVDEGSLFVDPDMSENLNTDDGSIGPSLVPSAFLRNRGRSMVAGPMFSRQCSFRV